MNRILLADDHAITRRGLIGILDHQIPDCIFEEAEDLKHVRTHLDDTAGKAGVALLVLDLNMPGMHGAATIRMLRETYKALRITILTAADDRETILACLAAGVHGYMLKGDAPSQLVDAVRIVMAGGVYVPPQLASVISERQTGVDALLASVMISLTTRQQEVLALLVADKSTKDIARALDLGVGTIKVHLNGVYRALGARNRTEAVTRFKFLTGVWEPDIIN